MKYYDPNIFRGVHTVKITLQQWQYKGHIWVKLGGNCKGLDIIGGFSDYFECSEGDFTDENDCDLKEEGGWWTGVLKSDDGDELLIDQVSRDMSQMVVAMEFERFEKEKYILEEGEF